ncbi:MAG TPA: CARDB domain-containing protein, partial [Thermodesulfobacteriota bacterium]|nr:CARDB domain-containing protein [Thermodesulfobacteriota bacterium]
SVNNGGSVAAQNVAVYFYYTDGCFTTNCQQLTVSVPAGGSVVLNPFTFGNPSTYKIFADPLNAIPESNEANNTLCLGNFCSADPPSCPPVG